MPGTFTYERRNSIKIGYKLCIGLALGSGYNSLFRPEFYPLNDAFGTVRKVSHGKSTFFRSHPPLLSQKMI